MKRRQILAATMILMHLPILGWAADPARQAMRTGAQAYGKQDYEAAAKAFDSAAQAAPARKLDPAAAYYNEANAFMKQGRVQEASSKYQDALRSDDLALQSRACYNRGNALFAMTESEENTNQLETAQQVIEESLRMYENAMTLAPGDEDAKVNYELALQKKKELEKKSEQQKQQQQQNQQNKDQQKQDQQKKEQEKKENQQKQDQNQSPQPQKPEQQQQAEPQKPTQEMTPQEARMMLDAMKQEEQANREKMRLMLGQPVPVDKDW